MSMNKRIINKYSSIRFAGEIHLVHYNSKYENLKKALTYHDGLAVVAVLLQVRFIYLHYSFNHFPILNRI